MDGMQRDHGSNGSRVISAKLLNRFFARQGNVDAPIKRVCTKPAGYFFKAWFSFLFAGHLQISRWK